MEDRRALARLGSGFMLLVAAVWILIVLGALVRANDAGLACPDWPLCFGELVPQLDVRVYQLGIPRQSAQKNDKRSRVILSQEIELGGKRRRRSDLARTERYLAGWDYEAKRVEVATVVAGHFVAVIGAQLRTDSARGYVDFFEAMRERNPCGVGPR